MNRFYAFLLIMLLPALLSAQSTSGIGKSDPEAKKVLDAVSKKFKTYKAVTAKFSLKMENGSGKIISSKNGTVYMKGGKYRVSIQGQEIFSDGSNVWTFDQASNEVTINKIDPSGNSLTPQKLFTNFYDKDFLYKLNGIKQVANKKMQEVELTPVDKTKPFHKVVLMIDNSSIFSSKIFEKTGNRYTYSVSSMNTTAAVDDKTFVFDAAKYPGVEIVDLR
jgi:outer membrane lipoprotein-sorting protein